MKIWNLVSTILIILLFAQFSNAISANIGQARVILRPTVEEGTTTVIERALSVVNQNAFDVNIVITTEDQDGIIELIDKEFTLAPSETKDAQFNINLKYGGNFQKRILVSFTPVDATYGTNSVGMVSNIFIYAKGPQAPPSIAQIANNTTTPETPAGAAASSNASTVGLGDLTLGNTAGNTVGLGGLTGDEQAPPKDAPKTANNGKVPSALIGIITVAAILFIGLIVFFIILKSGVLK